MSDRTAGLIQGWRLPGAVLAGVLANIAALPSGLYASAMAQWPDRPVEAKILASVQPWCTAGSSTLRLASSSRLFAFIRQLFF
jgi:hypothetical protein